MNILSTIKSTRIAKETVSLSCMLTFPNSDKLNIVSKETGEVLGRVVFGSTADSPVRISVFYDSCEVVGTPEETEVEGRMVFIAQVEAEANEFPFIDKRTGLEVPSYIARKITFQSMPF